VLIFGSMIFTSCEKDDGDPAAPELPPIESIAMDFSDFMHTTTMQQDIKSGEYRSVESYSNYTHAAINVGFWSSISGLTLAIPMASYAAALESDPEYLGDFTWEWTFIVSSNNLETITGRLVASRLSPEEYSAEMYISRTGPRPVDEFKWFEGVISNDLSGSSWTLYESPANPVELISVEWNHYPETDLYDVKYQIIKEASEEYGSSILFEITGNEDYDARYTVSLSTRSIEIEWNRETGAGHVKDMIKYGDELWHCWDEFLMDSNC